MALHKINTEKITKENPSIYRIWQDNKKEIQKTVDFLSGDKWVISGKIYIRKLKKGIYQESPIVITIRLTESIPKHEYVSLGFVLDEIITSAKISVIDEQQTQNDVSKAYLFGSFNGGFLS